MLLSRLRGYTLIEVLVAIAIIAILVGLGMPAYNSYRKKAYIGPIFQFLDPYEKRLAEQCNMDSGASSPYNIFGTGSAGFIAELNGATPAWAAYRGLGDVRWYYTTSGSPPYLSIRFDPTVFPASNGIDSSYLFLYMVDNGNCNISWICQNHATAQYRMVDAYLPKFCASGNTYGQ